jgi:TonB family protein
MSKKQTKKTSAVSLGLIGLMVVLAGVAVYIVKGVLSEDSPRKKNNVTTVTLLKPPPPQVKEKPPEPEPVKQMQKQEVIADIPQNAAQQDSKPAGEPDNAPAGSNLGVDAEGTAGSDAFGLVANKGGRSLLAGGGGSGIGNLSLMTKHAGYIQSVESELHKRVKKHLDDEGWFPKGKLQTIVRISIDARGNIVQFSIIGSSGNHKMDEAVKLTLRDLKISPPPENKFTTLSVKVNSQG